MLSKVEMALDLILPDLFAVKYRGGRVIEFFEYELQNAGTYIYSRNIYFDIIRYQACTD